MRLDSKYSVRSFSVLPLKSEISTFTIQIYILKNFSSPPPADQRLRSVTPWVLRCLSHMSLLVMILFAESLVKIKQNQNANLRVYN